MSDIALFWDPQGVAADIEVARGALTTDDGLRTAILISLFTDARAGDDDALPEPGADRRGWWANAFPRNGGEGELGSKLWLLGRAKTTAETLARAQDYAREALGWIVADGIAAAVDVSVERQTGVDMERLAIGVTLDRPTGPAQRKYDFVWEASA